MKERRLDERRPGWWWAYNVIFDREEFASYSRLVYCALCRLASHGGECWPSHGTLAKMTGLSVRSVQRGLEQLQHEVLISKTQRRSADGDLTSNLYTLLHQAEGGVSEAPPSGPRGTTVVTEGPRKDDLLEGRPTEAVKARAQRACPLPPDYELDDKHMAFGLKGGFLEAEVRSHFGKFKAYHYGQGDKKVNWFFAWCYWLRNEYDFAQQRQLRGIR